MVGRKITDKNEKELRKHLSSSQIKRKDEGKAKLKKKYFRETIDRFRMSSKEERYF